MSLVSSGLDALYVRNSLIIISVASGRWPVASMLVRVGVSLADCWFPRRGCSFFVPGICFFLYLCGVESSQRGAFMLHVYSRVGA